MKIKIKKIYGRWKGFYKLKCKNCNEQFYCVDKKEIICESCLYDLITDY